MRIVTSEGLSALTMARLAKELRCSVGTVYNVFPSKDALVAELQHEALDILYGSFLLSQSHLDDHAYRTNLRTRLHALTRVLGSARFLISAESVFPLEIELSRRVFIDPTFRLTDQEAGRVVPSAFRFLEHASRLIEEAAVAGAYRSGESLRRSVILVAGTTGIQLSSVLARFDPALFDATVLADQLVVDLLTGWGTDAIELKEAQDVIDQLTDRGLLVPGRDRQ